MSAVVVGYARTPFVRFTGVFAEVPATVLGAHALTAALERAGVRPEEVDRVVGGQVLQAGAGQNPARQSAAGAGIPLTVPAITLNAVCLSGLEAVAEGARMIADGRARIVVAVGQESMSLAPHAWPGSRLGKRYGAVEFLDTMDHDGLTDAFEHRSMGASTEDRNEANHVTREEQDAWAALSHDRLAAGAEFLQGEIVPFTTPGRRGRTISADDGLRPGTTAETLAGLRPAFTEHGGITAGNSSQITDGAAAIVLMDEELAAERAAQPLARILSSAFVAGPDVSLHAQPANAALKALALADRETVELQVVEINEAFAAVAVVSTRLLGVDPLIVNMNGGAIALGHPIGASGTRIAGHVARSLAALGPGSLGVAAICGGGGQGAALLLESVEAR
jgi:acetyl-CoA C-acetyltransferase